MTRVRRAWAAVMVAFGVVVATLLGAAPAQAWPGDPVVYVYGDDGCNGAQSATVYGLAPNGEFRSGQFGYWGGYALTFTAVPAGGENVRFDVFCSGTGWHTSSRWVSRPASGTSLNVNL